MAAEKKIIQEDDPDSYRGDLLELARVIWSKRRFILKVTGIFMALGLLIAFTSKVEYEASCADPKDSYGKASFPKGTLLEWDKLMSENLYIFLSFAN